MKYVWGRVRAILNMLTATYEVNFESYVLCLLKYVNKRWQAMTNLPWQ